MSFGVTENKPSPVFSTDSGFAGDMTSPGSDSSVSSDHCDRSSKSDLHHPPHLEVKTTLHSNQATFQRTYRVKYLGFAVLDRRYTYPMLPWIVADVRRDGLKQPQDVLLEFKDYAMKAMLYEDAKPLFEHKLNTISKFAQTAQDHACFTYLMRDNPEVSPSCHVFQAADKSTVLELFTTMREMTKELSQHQNSLSPLIRMNSGTGLDTFLSNSNQFEVLYVGKIKVPAKRAPASFIDDTVEKFRLRESERLKYFQQSSENDLKPSGLKRQGSNLSPSHHITAAFESVKENGFFSPNCKNQETNLLRASSDNISSGSEFSSLENISEVGDCEDSPERSKSPSKNLKPATINSLVTQTQSLDPLTRAALLDELKECAVLEDSSNSLVPPPMNSLITHTQSLDMQSKQTLFRDLQECATVNVPTSPSQRVRSVSGDVPRPSKQTSLPPYRTRVCSGGSADLKRPRSDSCTPQPSNRTMLFLIGKTEMCLLSTDRKLVLVNKTFSDISHCSQGVINKDHFGFICREASICSSDSYVGYVFKCSSTQVVDEIMQSLKQAFRIAHETITQRSQSQSQAGMTHTICDTCPMQKFHKLCVELEGLSPEKSQNVIKKWISHLSEQDREGVISRYQGAEAISLQEQNEIYMMLLRSMCERKQMKHHHTGSHRHEGMLDKRSSSFKFDNFKEKAKKSLSTSFETILKLKVKEHEPRGRSATLPSEEAFKYTLNETSPTSLGAASLLPEEPLHREGSCDLSDSTPYGKDKSSPPPQQRPRSSTISTVREVQVPQDTPRKTKYDPNTPPTVLKRSPMVNIFMKVGSQTKLQCASEEDLSVSPNTSSSCRQAIYNRIHTTPIQNNESHIIPPFSLSAESTPEKKDEEEDPHKKTPEELRNLWKKAIMEQILLIRMERENKRLQVRQDAATNKRMRLDYEEINPCLKKTIQVWEELLSDPNAHTTRMDPYALQETVKAGIPRHKRGEIWQLLAEQYKLRSPACTSHDVDLTAPYQELLNQLTVHQHAILIDLGRTFPNHPYYKDSLGSGQLSLFNLLKAYSLLDPEVGYCQGLSFVAGVLLLHMPEENAFEMMKHTLFHLGFRRQYKPDMIALQVQLYQLYRLVHDNYKELYQHFEKFEIAPTLYAAPWFLTLFASQFPLGYVSRLFDLIFLQGIEAVFKVALVLLGNHSDVILSCNSFESIMDCLKSKLPAMNIIEMERLFTQVFSLDIGKQLLAYEVEYHVIQEEMLYTPRKAPVAETDQEDVRKLKEANRNLKRQNMELLEQLQVAHNNVHTAEATAASYQSTIKHLETRVHSLEDEREALLHSLNILRHRLERLETTDDNSSGSRPTSLKTIKSMSLGDEPDGITLIVRDLKEIAEEEAAEKAAKDNKPRRSSSIDSASSDEAGGSL